MQLEIKNVFLQPEIGLIIASEKIKKVFREQFFEPKIKQNKCFENNMAHIKSLILTSTCI